MQRIAHQAALLSISRIANFGLMIISPVVLVRFLTVSDFGRYREFLLYASLLQTMAAFAISESLLYFVPLYPASPWRVVRATLGLTALISISVVAGFVVIDLLVPGGLVGPYLVTVSLYVLLFVNVDCWETFWVATRRPDLVFAYTAGRLMARMLVVVCAAVLTNNVNVIVWSLVILEAVRLAGAMVIWRKLQRATEEPPISNIRREQLRFCVPFGLASALGLVGRNLGNLVITKYLGVVALAQLTIGTYADPIIIALRGSVSAVVLPELVRRLGSQSQDEALHFWHRSVSITCLLLFPVAIIGAWYAEPVIVTVFGHNYRPAIPILQWYSLVVVRCCFDFSPPLRAINQTRPFMTAASAALVVNGIALWLLLPLVGIVGAAIAMVISSATEGGYLAWCMMRFYRCSVRRILPWGVISKIAICALLAAVIAFGLTYAIRLSIVGVVVGSALYALAFAGLLRAMHVQEAETLLESALSFVPGFGRFRRSK
jgi:O-antigen/teichoic acid export membrane protein